MKFVPFKRLTLAIVTRPCFGGSPDGLLPLVVGGVASGAFVATDRRTSGAQLEDEGIELRATSRIRSNVGERVHVNLTSYNRQVLLTGEVPNAQDKQLVEQIVARVENVNSVVNELAVMGTSTLTQRSSDTLVTGRVKAMLVDARDLSVQRLQGGDRARHDLPDGPRHAARSRPRHRRGARHARRAEGRPDF
jgi:hypothetical protein